MCIKLEEWACAALHLNLYSPPRQVLQGRLEDGRFVRTSPIKSIKGPFVTTESNTVYQLGKPAEIYVEFCKQNGFHIPTPETPIRIIDHDSSQHRR